MAIRFCNRGEPAHLTGILKLPGITKYLKNMVAIAEVPVGISAKAVVVLDSPYL